MTRFERLRRDRFLVGQVSAVLALLLGGGVTAEAQIKLCNRFLVPILTL